MNRQDRCKHTANRAVFVNLTDGLWYCKHCWFREITKKWSSDKNLMNISIPQDWAKIEYEINDESWYDKFVKWVTTHL